MCSIALCGDNSADIISASLCFEQQNANYFLIVYLKAFPEEQHWFPMCDLMDGIGNGINKQPDFGALLSRVHASHFGNTCITIIATLGPINPLIDCLIAQNPSTVPRWPTGVALGIVGFVSTFPHAISFIPPLFLLLFYRAWSMRLDLQCNGIKHIVSHLWERRIEPIKPQTCPAGKLIKSCTCRKEKLCWSCSLVKFTTPPLPEKTKKPLHLWVFLCCCYRFALLSYARFRKKSRSE